MRNLALLATAGATLLVISGCARWTLRPLHTPRESATTSTPEKFGTLSSLMQRQSSGAASNAAAAADASNAQDPALVRAPQAGLEKLPPELAVARLSERQGDEAQSRSLYLAFSAKQPLHPLPHHRLGVMAARNSRLDEAEQHLRKAMELSPPSAELLSDMGYLCYLQSRFDEAEHYLQQALEQEPDNASATNNLAIVYGARGDFDKSLRYFRRVNDDAKSHANVAYTMTQQGQLEDARNEYLHALTIDKTLRSAANALVQIEQSRKTAEQAAKRRGIVPPAAAERDEVIELSTNAPAPAPSPEHSPEPYRPQPRSPEPEQISHDVTPPATQQASHSKPNVQGTLAGRLMPLPPLPDDEVGAGEVSPAAAEPRFVPIAQLQERTRQAGDESCVAPAAPRRSHSQFTQLSPPAESTQVALPTESPIEAVAISPTALPDIFAEARQVAWDADVTSLNGEAQNASGVIPIPTVEPVANAPLGDATLGWPTGERAESAVRQAIAVAPTTPAKTEVRQVAVQMELSDATAAAPAKSQPVKTQFSDFETAPSHATLQRGKASAVKTQFSDFGSAPARLAP